MAIGTHQPTLDQQRAAYAWGKVTGCSNEYVVLVKGAGALIMANGLMATLAFYQGKGKDHHKALNSHLMAWLKSREVVDEADFTAVMTSLHSATSAHYRYATQEVLDLIRWLRHFAAAVDKG